MSTLAKGLGRVAGYVYRDDAYCPDCIAGAVDATGNRPGMPLPRRLVEGWLDRWAALEDIDRNKPRSWSNHAFPDRLYATAIDVPWVCETCRKEIR